MVFLEGWVEGDMHYVNFLHKATIQFILIILKLLLGTAFSGSARGGKDKFYFEFSLFGNIKTI